MLVRSTVLALMLTFVAAPGSAQAAPEGFDANPQAKFRVGIDFPTSIVVGDPLNNYAVVGIGIGLARVEYQLLDELTLMARVGAIAHIPKNDFMFWEVPFFVGAKYYMGQLFVSGEIGANYLDITYRRDDEVFSGRGNYRDATRFGGAFLAGIQLGDFEVKGGFWIPSFAHMDQGVEIAIQAGYSFLYF